MPSSHGVEPGDKAPTFNLPNANKTHGESVVGLDGVIGETGGVVMFTCNHCPYVVASEGSCLLYTSPSPRDFEASRMPSSA